MIKCVGDGDSMLIKCFIFPYISHILCRKAEPYDYFRPKNCEWSMGNSPFFFPCLDCKCAIVQLQS